MASSRAFKCTPFNLLSGEERDSLLAFINRHSTEQGFPDVEEMVEALTAPAFGGGAHVLTLRTAKGDFVGLAGVVAREAVAKGEAYIVHFVVRRGHPEAVGRLISLAYDLLSGCGVPGETVVKLGLREALGYLRPEVERAGFSLGTRYLEMRLDDLAVPNPAKRLEFRRLDPVNIDEYVAVHNAAFLGSPNAGQITADEARAALAKLARPDFAQVGYLGSLPAAMIDLALTGGTGRIENLAVNPSCQGAGLGMETLRHAVRVLAFHGAEQVRLGVIEANARALALYRRAGFVLDRVVSCSFVGPRVAEGPNA